MILDLHTHHLKFYDLGDKISIDSIGNNIMRKEVVNAKLTDFEIRRDGLSPNVKTEIRYI